MSGSAFSFSATARSGRRSERRLRTLVAWLVGLPLLAIVLRDSALGLPERLMAGVTWVLCWWPAYRYVGSPPERRRPIPFLPVIGVVFAAYFPLQAVLGATDVYGRFEVEAMVATIEASTYSTAIFLVFTGWTLALLGYWFAAGPISRSPRRRVERELDAPRLAGAAFLVLGISLAVEIFKRVIVLSGPMRGVVYFVSSLTSLALALLIAIAVQGKLRPRYKPLLILAILITFVLQASTGASAVVAITVITIGMAVLLAGGRITWRWIVLGILGISLFAGMRGVALEHRRATMATGIVGSSTASERAVVMFALLGRSITEEGPFETVANGLEIATTRSALLDLLADVIRQTPAIVPYWDGETYKSLVGAFVPRILWPDKPVKMLGYQFGHRYGYLRPTDYTTTINLPFLVEFYANFSSGGVMLGMLVVGIIWGLLDRHLNRPGQSLLRSMFALGIMIPLINLESDFSLVFGGMFITGGTLFVLYRFATRYATASVRRAPSRSTLPTQRRSAPPNPAVTR